MSWQATAWAERQVTGSPARKVLLLVLANYADEDGVCWPSQETLSRGTEQSVDTIQRQLRKLEQMNILGIATRPQGRGRWPGRTYKLNMAVAEKTEPQSAAQSDNVTNRNEVTLSDVTTEPHPARDHTATSTPHRAATSTVTVPQALRHEPSTNIHSEPSVEPSANIKPKLKAVARQQAFQCKRVAIEVLQNQIARRLGPEGWIVLQSISQQDLEYLTTMQERRQLTDRALEEFKLLWKSRRDTAS